MPKYQNTNLKIFPCIFIHGFLIYTKVPTFYIELRYDLSLF